MILFITEQNSKLSIKDGSLIIKTEERERKVPKDLVEQISLFGNIGITNALISHCLKNDIPISYYSMTGEYFGRTRSTRGDHISRLKKQLCITENKEFVLEFTKIIIEAKTNNQITLLRRHKKYNPFVEEEIMKMNQIKSQIERAKTKEEILGIEGIRSRAYDKEIAKILPEEFRFDKRTRRPPLDPFNSMISLGYTILLHEIIGHIESVGLTAYGGIIHGHRRNHPSLASDLIEELRAPIVDALVVSMIQNKKVVIDDFDVTDNGVFLKKELLKKYLSALQTKLQTQHKYLPYISALYRKEYPLSKGNILSMQTARTSDRKGRSHFIPTSEDKIMRENHDDCKKYDEKRNDEKKLILIIYDIADNRRRTKFYRYLSGYMTPVQRSCFEGHLSDIEFNKLIKKIDRYIDKEEDHVRCYKLSGFGKVYHLGKTVHQPIEEIIII